MPVHSGRRGRLSLVVFTAAIGLFATADVSAAPCPGVDYSDELVLSNFAIASQTPVDATLAAVEISADVVNLDIANFASATATLDVSTAGLGVQEAPAPTALGFGPIGPVGAASSATSVTLTLPSANVVTLVDALNNGDIPISVSADETELLAPNVKLNVWRQGDDSTAPFVGYIPGSGLTFVRTTSGCALEPNIVNGFQAGDDAFYILEDAGIYVPELVPAQFRNQRVTNVTCSDDGLNETWNISLADTDNDVLFDLIISGSYCTDSRHQINELIQASRLAELDGISVGELERDGHAQPVRFNNVPFNAGDVTVSGQVQGHVLKPGFQLRIRQGRAVAKASVDTDLSLTASMTVHADTSFAPQENVLLALCFPLPGIALGPIRLPLALHLQHAVGAEVDLAAGAVVGFQKQFSGGSSVMYDGRLPPGQQYVSESHSNSTPIAFTPPRLNDETGAHAIISTSIRTALRMGSVYPECDLAPLVAAEASVEAKVFGRLDVAPGQDPWWTLSHGAEVETGFGMTLLGLPIADFSAQPTPLAEPDVLDGIRPLPGEPVTSGEDQRWAVSIDALNLTNSVDETAVAEHPDGGAVVVASGPVTSRNRLIKLDRFGAFEWAVQYRSRRQPIEVATLPDGSIIVAGETLWLAKHDSNGNLLWNMEYDIGDPNQTSSQVKCTLNGMLSVEEATGQFSYVLVGRMTRSLVTQHDACAVKVDDNGNVVWSKFYEDVDLQDFFDATATAGGDLVMVGKTKFGSDPLSKNNPLVVRVDGQTGDIEWAKALPMGGLGRNRAGRFNAVTQAADGTLYMAGSSGPVITQTGGLLVGRIAPDGGDVRYSIILQDELWEANVFGPFIDSPGGDTPFDEAHDIAAVAGGFVVVGKTGLQSGLALNQDAQASWAFKVNAGLGLEWFVTIDGNPNNDVGEPLTTEVLHSVSPTAEGFLVSGTSNAFDPLGIGGGETTITVMKFPFEGQIGFLPEANIVSRYIEPGVRAGSIDSKVLPASGDVSLDAPLTAYDASVNFAVPIVDLLVTPDDLCVHLVTEPGHISLNDACVDDSDGDGTPDNVDGCVNDANKIAAGICGCGVADTDTDTDGTADCNDLCPADASKIAAGICGCGVADTDTDADGTADCNDLCPADTNKTTAGICGCGVPETDTDNDGDPDCIDAPDSDEDGLPDDVDVCPFENPGQLDGNADGCIDSFDDIADRLEALAAETAAFTSGPRQARAAMRIAARELDRAATWLRQNRPILALGSIQRARRALRRAASHGVDTSAERQQIVADGRILSGLLAP